MKNKKLLFILIPVLIVVLVLIAGVVYLKLNSSPEKIFKNSITKVFSMIEPKKEDYSTVKGTMKFTGSFESENEEMQAINTMLEGSSIVADMQADIANMIINENINVTYNNESLINAAIIMQDEKGYVYLKDYLDKYLELPEEEMDYSELSDLYKKSATLNQNLLMNAIEEELIRTISNQNLLQEGTTLVLDGQETKVTASTLSLKGEAQTIFTRELLTNLKENEKFQTALGAFKDDILRMIDEGLQTQTDKKEVLDRLDSQQLTEVKDVNEEEIKFTIYTKGLLNEFVGVSGMVVNDSYYEGYSKLEILKHNDSKYEFVSYEGKREEAKITVEINKENKDKGTATITMIADEEQYTFVYNYEKQGNQLSFALSTEFEGVGLSISGNAIENGNNIKGNMVISVQEETFGRANLNYEFDLTYGVEIQKVNTENAVLIDELSEEDQTTLMTNLQNSPLYQLVEQFSTIDSGLNTLNDEPEVTYDRFTVRYNVPNGFEISEYSSEDHKMYMDENYNSISVTINYDSVDTYMKELEDEYVLTSDFYENQKISNTRSMDINGKEYKLRTLTYNDEYGSYANLYFAYELDDEYCYTVEVESEGGNISMDTIKYFLDMTVEKESLQNMFNDAEEFLNDGQI